MFLCIWLPEMVSFSVAGFGWPRKSCRQNRFTTTIYYLPTYLLPRTYQPSQQLSQFYYYGYYSYSTTRLQYIGIQQAQSLKSICRKQLQPAHFPVSHIMTTTTTAELVGWLPALDTSQFARKLILLKLRQVGKMILKDLLAPFYLLQNFSENPREEKKM